MTSIICLNELSCQQTLDDISEVDRVMRDFVAVLLAVRQVRPAAALITVNRLPGIELATGYPMARWAADGRHRDLWRSIRRMQDKAPQTFEELLPTDEREDREYRHRGEVALGLGLAHELDGLAVSLATGNDWAPAHIPLERIWIDAEDEAVTARNASTVGHVAEHRDWLTSDTAGILTTGHDLWQLRAEHFPSLSFLPRVQDDLAALPAASIGPVVKRLIGLENAVANWDSSSGLQPVWPSLTTPEHEHRKKICEFEDLDGKTRLFDLHARFTPGEGRIHFRLVGELNEARIAYIGRKLGI